MIRVLAACSGFCFVTAKTAVSTPRRFLNWVDLLVGFDMFDCSEGKSHKAVSPAFLFSATALPCRGLNIWAAVEPGEEKGRLEGFG